MQPFLLLLGLTAAPVLAIPTAGAPPEGKDAVHYPAPPGGWESVHYPKGTGENLGHYPAPPGGWESVDYPEGTGENLAHYPAPPGGWESVDYSGGGGGGKDCPQPPPVPLPMPIPFAFTAFYAVDATPEQVVNGTPPMATGGLAGCHAHFAIGINVDHDLICWNITLTGFRGDYSSPAVTATHIHQAAVGKSGPPRIAFPDPVGDGHERTSIGCMTGPFVTGVVTNGSDTGEGFTLAQIQNDPAGFYADVHSSLAVPGAVRGQLA